MFNGENLNLPYNQIEAMKKFIYSKVLNNVNHSNLSDSDKECIRDVFKKCEDRISTVNIVRCKDCRYMLKIDSAKKPYTESSVGCLKHDAIMEGTDFCNYGER